jgi:hypothetical protein
MSAKKTKVQQTTVKVHPEIYRLQGKLKMWKGEVIRREELLDDEKFAKKETQIKERIAALQADIIRHHEHRETAPARLDELAAFIERDERLIAAMEANPDIIPLISLARRTAELEKELAED